MGKYELFLEYCVVKKARLSRALFRDALLEAALRPAPAFLRPRSLHPYERGPQALRFCLAKMHRRRKRYRERPKTLHGSESRRAYRRWAEPSFPALFSVFRGDALPHR